MMKKTMSMLVGVLLLVPVLAQAQDGRQAARAGKSLLNWMRSNKQAKGFTGNVSVYGGFDYDKMLEEKVEKQLEEKMLAEQKKREIDLAEAVPENFTINLGYVYKWYAPQKVEADGYTIYLDTTYPDKGISYPKLGLRFELKKGVKKFPADKITFHEQFVKKGTVHPHNSNGYEYMDKYAVVMQIQHGDKVTQHELGLSAH